MSLISVSSRMLYFLFFRTKKKRNMCSQPGRNNVALFLWLRFELYSRPELSTKTSIFGLRGGLNGSLLKIVPILFQ